MPSPAPEVCRGTLFVAEDPRTADRRAALPVRVLAGRSLPAFDGLGRLCYKKFMTATLSVRLPVDDKRRLFDAAARQGRSANDLVREAIRREVGAEQSSSASPLAEFFGSVDSAPPAPTNAAVRRAMRRGRK